MNIEQLQNVCCVQYIPPLPSHASLHTQKVHSPTDKSCSDTKAEFQLAVVCQKGIFFDVVNGICQFMARVRLHKDQDRTHANFKITQDNAYKRKRSVDNAH